MRLTTTKNCVALLKAHQFDAIIGDLKHSIPEAIDSMPMREIIVYGASKSEIEGIVAILVLKASHRLSVGGNLKQGAAAEIAREIVTDYPLLSLDDLNILLTNGCKGRYGQIFRFDLSVIYDWIRNYEDEKAIFIEDKIKPEKVQEIAPNAREMSPETQELVNGFMRKLLEEGGMRHVSPVDYEDLMSAKKPLKKKSISQGVRYASWDELENLEYKLQWARECTDIYTGNLKPGMPTYSEWLKTR